MPIEEIKQNDIKYSKPEKKGEKKTKNRCHEQKTISTMVGINPTISIITLSVNCLTVPVKSQRFSEWIKQQDSTKCCLKKPTLNKKTPVKNKGMEKDITC